MKEENREGGLNLNGGGVAETGDGLQEGVKE